MHLIIFTFRLKFCSPKTEEQRDVSFSMPLYVFVMYEQYVAIVIIIYDLFVKVIYTFRDSPREFSFSLHKEDNVFVESA